MLVEEHRHSCNALKQRVESYLAAHQELAGIVDVDVRCDDCNVAVTDYASSVPVDANTPAFIFVDPFGLAIQRSTMDTLMTMPWAVDVLFNYMLDGIKRVYGASIGNSTRASSNAETLAAYFGDDVSLAGQADIESPRTYACATFGAHGLRTVAFLMKWPTKSAIQYILLFASRKPTVVDIMRKIYAKEMTDTYGQGTLFGTEEHLADIEVIEP